jgi:hypothetical protein
MADRITKPMTQEERRLLRGDARTLEVIGNPFTYAGLHWMWETRPEQVLRLLDDLDAAERAYADLLLDDGQGQPQTTVNSLRPVAGDVLILTATWDGQNRLRVRVLGDIEGDADLLLPDGALEGQWTASLDGMDL